jgi:hypothetical protein
MKQFKILFAEVWNGIAEKVWFQSALTYFRNKDVLVFLFFLFISTSFWFFNALRHDYVTDFSFNVRLTNVPDHLVLLDSDTKEVNIKVRSSGYSLLRQYLSNSLVPVNYDVSQLRRTPSSGKAYLLAREQYRGIKEQLLVGVELLSLTPDTVFISLDEKKEKKVSVVLGGNVEFQKQYALAGNIICQPESVSVSGPQSIVDTITAVQTVFKTFEALSDTLVREIDLLPLDGVTYSDSKVKVTIPVEPFSEKTFIVPLEVAGLPDSLRLKTFPPEITVTLRAGLSRFESIDASEFRAEVDAAPLVAVSSGSRPQRLRVRLTNKPDKVQSIDFFPLYVEYILERRR